jgi:hypothetical protein
LQTARQRSSWLGIGCVDSTPGIKMGCSQDLLRDSVFPLQKIRMSKCYTPQ